MQDFLDIHNRQTEEQLSQKIFHRTLLPLTLQDRPFRVIDLKNLVQYATFYYKRLTVLKDQVKEMALKMWGTQGLTYNSNILDIKPCILRNIAGVIKDECKQINYCTEDDHMILEDSSGRIRIGKNLRADGFVTGSIIGLRGQVDKNGLFDVEDFCYAGIGFNPSIPPKIDIKKTRSLIDEDGEDRQFVAFISGLEFGLNKNPRGIQELLRFLRGDTGTMQERRVSSQISMLVFAGDSISAPTEQDEVHRGSFRTQDRNQKIYNKISDLMDEFEQTVLQCITNIDAIIMPGESDFTSSLMPQQPLHSSLFPFISQTSKRVRFTTNPTRFEINGVQFLGTSGQNIQDIERYTRYKEPVEMMELTLKMRHICPTCPDTLRSYPFVQNDPFVIEHFPHVYFSGNTTKFQHKTVRNESGCFVKLVSIPRFNQTGSVVLLDMESMDCYEYRIEVGAKEEIVEIMDS